MCNISETMQVTVLRTNITALLVSFFFSYHIFGGRGQMC